jgi:hypothetical protein
MSRFSDFHIYSRKNSKGKKLYYARFLDPVTGKTICSRPTGQSNKIAATRVAESSLTAGLVKSNARP